MLFRSPGDLRYIRSKAPHLEKMLLQERSRLAKSWLHENRLHLRQLLRLHKLIERTNENLSIRLEFQVLSTYASLRAMLLAAEIAVIFGGPFNARGFGLGAMTAFDRLSATIADTVQALDPGKRAAIRTSWARSS